MDPRHCDLRAQHLRIILGEDPGECLGHRPGRPGSHKRSSGSRQHCARSPRARSSSGSRSNACSCPGKLILLHDKTYKRPRHLPDAASLFLYPKISRFLQFIQLLRLIRKFQLLR